MSIRALTLAAALVVSLSLAGCVATAEPEPTTSPSPTRTPSPSPTPTAAPAPVLSADGFGAIEIGFEVDPAAAADLVAFDDDYCVGVFAENGLGEYPADQDPGRWRPVAEWATGPSFSVQTQGGVVTRVDTVVPGVATAEGIQVGSTADEVIAAYPDASVQSFPVSDVYVIAGERGLLLIEVARDYEPGYWPADELDRVLVMNASSTEFGVYRVAGGDNRAGEC